MDSQASKWSWARFPPLSRSEAGNRACQPSSEKNPGDEVGQPYTISFKTDDLMENSRGKRCALDIQDY